MWAALTSAGHVVFRHCGWQIAAAAVAERLPHPTRAVDPNLRILPKKTAGAVMSELALSEMEVVEAWAKRLYRRMSEVRNDAATILYVLVAVGWENQEPVDRCSDTQYWRTRLQDCREVVDTSIEGRIVGLWRRQEREQSAQVETGKAAGDCRGPDGALASTDRPHTGLLRWP